MKTKNKKQTLLLIPIGIILGMVIVELFFREGPIFILLFSIPMVIIIGVPCIAITLVLQHFIKPLNSKTTTIIISVVLCFGIILIGKNQYSPSPKALSERFLPIENLNSISEIRGVIEYPGIDHVVRLSFKISPTEFESLVKRGNFKSSKEDSPYRVPFVKTYHWWNYPLLKTLQQYSSHMEGETNILWYDPQKTVAWFMSVDT